jgi:predicted Fe-S protein YdhL (DUF1289 family)
MGTYNIVIRIVTFMIRAVPIWSLSSSPLKPTPCTRICRYNSNFYNGQVCIGCFRDTTEISCWSQFSNLEKGLALEDASERLLSASIPFEGGISVQELKSQAQLWMNLHEEQ